MGDNDRQLILRAVIRAAVEQATRVSSTPRKLLTEIILGHYRAEFANGRTVVSTTEAGGTVTFSFPSGLDAGGVMALAEEAIEWLEQQTDPDAPDLARFKRVRRLRASFSSSNIA